MRYQIIDNATQSIVASCNGETEANKLIHILNNSDRYFKRGITDNLETMEASKNEL